MFTQSFNSDCLFDRLQEIYERVQGAEWNITLEISIQEDVDFLSDFWRCSKEESLVFSIMLYQVITNGETSIRKVLDHLDLKPSQATRINGMLKSLVERDWLSPRKDASLYPFTEYYIPISVVRATLENRFPEIQALKTYSLEEFVVAFERILNKRRSRTWSYDVFVEEIRSIFNTFQKNGFFIEADELKLDDPDLMILVWTFHTYYMGNNNLDIDEMLSVLCPNRSVQYHLRQTFIDGSFSLIRLGLIQCSDRDSLFDNFQLTAKGLRLFDPNSTIKSLRKESPFLHIEPQKIISKDLIFDREQQGMVNKLYDLFDGKRFQELRSRLIDQGMSSGVNILLFGGPGTGKTETVYQLARNTQRMILSADASKIRSKWVGETEKNTRQLFEQYRELMNEQAHAPILLFNEADAILGKRSSTDNRVDQMENAMQNILLEELEKFEGIFMATTNLEATLDDAFDRRFLYKFKFEKPGSDARLKLWQSKFPGLKKSILQALNDEFDLTGAQIENIRKKKTIDQVLEPRLKLDFKYFQTLAQQELLLIKGKDGSTRNAIGFLQSN